MSLSDVADLSMSLSDVAVPINGDAEHPLSAEVAFDDNLLGMGRGILSKPVEKIDDFDPSLDVEGEKYQKVHAQMARR